MRAWAQRLAVVLLAAPLAFPAQAGAPDYDAFSDRDGRITTRQHGLGLFKLVGSAVELEAVFEDSRSGNARAKRVFEELETSYFPDTGRELAELVSRPPCLVPALRELSGWCVPDWSFLDFLSKDKPGGVRLRVALLNGYLERARQRNLENQLLLSAMTSILGVSVVANALREAGIAASISGVPEAQGVVTVEGSVARGVKAPEHGTFYVDPKGNVVPTPPGGRITASPDGRFIQARRSRQPDRRTNRRSAQASKPPRSACAGSTWPCARSDQSGRHAMASDQPLAREEPMADLTWGDTVRVRVGAEAAKRPGAMAEVVGIREIENEAQAQQFQSPIGSKLYLIEFGDGTSVEIPEGWIEAAE